MIWSPEVQLPNFWGATQGNFGFYLESTSYCAQLLSKYEGQKLASIFKASGQKVGEFMPNFVGWLFLCSSIAGNTHLGPMAISLRKR